VCALATTPRILLVLWCVLQCVVIVAACCRVLQSVAVCVVLAIWSEVQLVRPQYMVLVLQCAKKSFVQQCVAVCV